MQLELFVVDAFTAKPFGGNPAAVCPLARWLPERTMQAIAAQNNLSETAFLVRRGARGGRGAPEARYGLRWFTPACEVPLCGHATLASAHVLFEHLGLRTRRVSFDTLSGELAVVRRGRALELELPARPPERVKLDPRFTRVLGRAPREAWQGIYPLFVYAKESDVRELEPDLAALGALGGHLGGGVAIVTAPGTGRVDFVSRFFAPGKGVPEDPVTGSAHATLVPYWAKRLGRTRLVARQVSRRVGELDCELAADRVLLVGRARTYLVGRITI
ncbi:MAG: PhzF family phenazine biosynthesis protein [Planctomycetes bacterium]|nr:PhzF family phenazine biosynthesis protein [Planctomycetota bacterium]